MSSTATKRMKRNNDIAYKIAVTKDGEPVDITGWTFYMAAKKNKSETDEEALFSYEAENTTDPTTGICVIDILATDTKDKDLGNYQCDVLIKDEDNKRRNSQTFIIELLHEVTDGDS